MPKNIFKKLSISILLTTQIFFLLFFIFLPHTVKAVDDFPVLKNPFDDLQVKIPGMERFSEPAPCPEDPSKTCVKWIGEYIAGIYNYAIGIVGIIAAVVLMFGGVTWLTAGGNQGRITEAKAWIGASLTGLIIALTSYLLLSQINPGLVGFKALRINVPSRMAGSSLSEGEKIGNLADDGTTRKLFKEQSNPINVNKAACASPYDTNCTSVADLPDNAVAGLIKLANDLADNCTVGSTCHNITITGGTEIGVHKTHGPNKPIVDLRLKQVNGDLDLNLLNLIRDKVDLGFMEQLKYYDGTNNTKYTATDNSFSVIREKNKDGSEHLHIIFN